MSPLPLILASGSPRRAWLLSLTGLPFMISLPGIREEEIAGESPEHHVVRLAGEKAADVGGRHPGRTILAADTAVILEGRIFGKPSGPEEGRRMLGELQGRAHQVLTGFAVLSGVGEVRSGFERSRVNMRRLSETEIEEYLSLGEYADKAGAYAAQGAGARIIERIDGSYTNVVGLPLGPILPLLREFGYEAVDPGLD